MQLVVAVVGVDPEARLHRGVRKPADSAERGRRHPAAAGRKPAARQLLGALLQGGVDGWRDRRALHRELAVALDEHQQHVVSAQSRQQPVGRRRAVGVVADHGAANRAGSSSADLTALTSCTVRPTALTEAIGTPLTSCAPATCSTSQATAERGHGHARRAPVAGRDAGQPQHREGGEDQRGEQRQTDAGHGQIGAGTAHRVAQRLDADRDSTPSPRSG